MADKRIVTQAFCLHNLSDGDAESQFSEKLADLIEEYKSGRYAGRDASIGMEVKISFTDDSGDSFIAALVSCRLKLPKRKAAGRIVRMDGGTPVIDCEETDAAGNRGLPFTVTTSGVQ